LEKGFTRGKIDTTLFTKTKNDDLLIVQIYVDDIVFGSMSMMGELNFFLGLQIKQTKNGIFINQSKYIKDLFKKFGIEKSKI